MHPTRIPHATPDASRAAYRRALDMLHTGQGDPLATIDRALDADPAFASGHCMRAALLVMACREDASDDLARTLHAARTLAGAHLDDREQRHLAAADAWLARELKRSLHLYAQIAVDFPWDTLALRVAHFGDLQWSRTHRLRDRVTAALSSWRADTRSHGHLLGMHAFGLAESGDHALAERVGRQALAIDPSNAGAIHAVAHVMEMQGRCSEGIDWLQSTASAWTRSPAYRTHLWWHLALYHLDLGDAAAALAIHDRYLGGHANAGSAAPVDASALLWRLQLSDVDVGGRWHDAADRWSRRPLDGLRPFNDAHAMLAYVGAARPTSADRLVRELRACAMRSPDLRQAVDEAALPVCEALVAFGAGRYAEAAAGLERISDLAQRCGGSHAQCDLLTLTLLEAALRSHRPRLAREVAAQRSIARPSSVLNQRIRARVGLDPTVAAPHRSTLRQPSRDRCLEPETT